MNFFIKTILTAVAVLISAYVLPGVEVAGFFTAVVLAIILALLNSLVKPVLIILTIPLTIISLGLFLVVINALIILLADWLVSGFYVEGFWWALIFSIILSLANSLLSELSGSDQK